MKYRFLGYIPSIYDKYTCYNDGNHVYIYTDLKEMEWLEGKPIINKLVKGNANLNDDWFYFDDENECIKSFNYTNIPTFVQYIAFNQVK